MNIVTDDIITADDLILVTGAGGFIGSRVVEDLLRRGHRNLRCLIRSKEPEDLRKLRNRYDSRIEVTKGNLLSAVDCAAAAKDARVVFHLAAGRGEKEYADAFMNSVVATRNLLEACRRGNALRRFVTVSSFAVYSNRGGGVLNEDSPVVARPELRGDAYTFAKVRQDELVSDYGKRFGIPYVIVRPGWVYGPGNEAITGRVGIGTFGVFLHLGGANQLPITYVDNCAQGIVLAGIRPGIDGQVFNVVDDDLPSSRRFLRLYKRHVKRFPSVYVPHILSYTLCYFWERYSRWSENQLPPVFNRSKWYSLWKSTRYSNQKLKSEIGWAPEVATDEGLKRYFASCAPGDVHA